MKVAPTSFKSLLNPIYKNQNALNNSPTTAGAAFAGVYAASLANGGSFSNIVPGIQYLAKLKKIGNFVPTAIGGPTTVQNGSTPILVWWDYLLASEVVPVVPGIFGLLIAYAIHTAKHGRLLRQVVITASGVFANFGGVPLAFLFIATLSTTGVVTGWLSDLGWDPWNHGFTLYDPVGVFVVNMYFQIPLMVLVILPALTGLRRFGPGQPAGRCGPGHRAPRLTVTPCWLPASRATGRPVTPLRAAPAAP